MQKALDGREAHVSAMTAFISAGKVFLISLKSMTIGCEA